MGFSRRGRRARVRGGIVRFSVMCRYRFEVEKARYYKENERAREVEEGRGSRVRREKEYY
jgi:hypothetical protein